MVIFYSYVSLPLVISFVLMVSGENSAFWGPLFPVQVEPPEVSKSQSL